MDRLNAVAPYLHLYEGNEHADRLSALLLLWIAKNLVPYRPNRLEPHALERRPNQYDRLNGPRAELRKALLRQ